MTGLNGVWATDVLGIDGWERTGITFLKDGNAHGGSADFFHHGSYSVEGQKVKMTLHLQAHGKIKQVYGKKRKNFTSKVKGTWKNEKIEGKARLLDSGSYDIAYNFRLTRLGDLPASLT